MTWNLYKKIVIEQTCVEAAPLLKYNEPDMSKEEAGPTTQAKHLVKWNQFGEVSVLSVGCKESPQNLSGIPSHGNQRWRNRPFEI